MAAYLLRRLLLVIPTLFGIIAINFVVVQFAPGGPVEQMIAELKGRGEGVTGRITGQGGAEAMPGNDRGYRGARVGQLGDARLWGRRPEERVPPKPLK